MTLRDIADWFSENIQVFKSDLGFLSSTSPMDWPLYILVPTVIVAFLALIITLAVVEASSETWKGFWARQYHENGIPQTRLGRATDRISDIAFLSTISVLIWLCVAGVVMAVLIDSRDHSGPIWVVFTLPTLFVFFFIFLVIRGRYAKKKSTSDDR
jgi:4-amino-4-deoxy-L-arabinose transferase-like glycosyltransferase